MNNRGSAKMNRDSVCMKAASVSVAAILLVCGGTTAATAGTPHSRPMADSCSAISDAMSTVYMWNDLVLKFTKLVAADYLQSYADEGKFISDSSGDLDKASRSVAKAMTTAYKASKNSQTRALLKSGIRYAKDGSGTGTARIYDKVMANLDYGKC
jgi:hypothetical protein